MTSPTDSPLQAMAAVRAEIDEIDDALHALVARRAGLIERVIAAKAAMGGGGAPLRPAREAQILRRLGAAHQATGSTLPFAAVAAMWRELISGATQMQGGLAVSVFAPEEGAARERVWRAARTHFGAEAAITLRSSAGRMMQDLAAHERAVGVAGPLEGMGEGDPWWRACLDQGPQAPRIVAALPFAARDGLIDAYVAAAHTPLEPSGDDLTLFGLHLGAPISRTMLAARLGKASAAGIEIRLAAASGSMVLVETDGFRAGADDPARAALAAAFEMAPADVTAAGVYARPMRI